MESKQEEKEKIVRKKENKEVNIKERKKERSQIKKEEFNISSLFADI